MPNKLKTIRWTIEFAASEFGTRRDRLTAALKAAGIQPGKDGKFGTRQIVEALYESVALEREAKAARHREQIDEAEMTKLNRETQEKRLIEREHVREMLADGLTKIGQIIRQSKLPASDRRQVVEQIKLISLDER